MARNGEEWSPNNAIIAAAEPRPAVPKVQRQDQTPMREPGTGIDRRAEQHARVCRQENAGKTR